MQNNRKHVDLEAVHTLLSFSRMACHQLGNKFQMKETAISFPISDSETWDETQSKFHFQSAKVSNPRHSCITNRFLKELDRIHLGNYSTIINQFVK